MAEKGKKQLSLRLPAPLMDALTAWAADEFRSVNGQIEFLLTECVRRRKKSGKAAPHRAEAAEAPADAVEEQLVQMLRQVCGE